MCMLIMMHGIKIVYLGFTSFPCAKFICKITFRMLETIEHLFTISIYKYSALYTFIYSFCEVQTRPWNIKRPFRLKYVIAIQHSYYFTFCNNINSAIYCNVKFSSITKQNMQRKLTKACAVNVQIVCWQNKNLI